MAELRVGTSGWHYGHWRGAFYPPDSRTREWLSYYARSFDTVEINNSFYRLPGRETFSAWAREVPPGFVFAVKGSRFITHLKKLRGVEEAVETLLDHAGCLGEKLGPILFQLPPRWRANPSRLEEFAASLPAGRRYAFEFRDESWLREEVYRVLEEHGYALCVASSPSFPSARRVTADFCFLRFHGGEVLYGSKYSRRELKGWADFARSLLRDGVDVYAYFNNDAYGFAVENALTFISLLD